MRQSLRVYWERAQHSSRRLSSQHFNMAAEESLDWNDVRQTLSHLPSSEVSSAERFLLFFESPFVSDCFVLIVAVAD
jgi:hypothetical protein